MSETPKPTAKPNIRKIAKDYNDAKTAVDDIEDTLDRLYGNNNGHFPYPPYPPDERRLRDAMDALSQHSLTNIRNARLAREYYKNRTKPNFLETIEEQTEEIEDTIRDIANLVVTHRNVKRRTL